jgi:hypothetical protein
MDGIASKIAQKICVFFEHQHLDPRTRQQKAEHHPRRAAARNAAPRLHSSRNDLIRRHDRRVVYSIAHTPRAWSVRRNPVSALWNERITRCKYFEQLLWTVYFTSMNWEWPSEYEDNPAEAIRFYWHGLLASFANDASGKRGLSLIFLVVLLLLFVGRHLIYPMSFSA